MATGAPSGADANTADAASLGAAAFAPTAALSQELAQLKAKMAERAETGARLTERLHAAQLAKEKLRQELRSKGVELRTSLQALPQEARPTAASKLFGPMHAQVAPPRLPPSDLQRRRRLARARSRRRRTVGRYRAAAARRNSTQRSATCTRSVNCSCSSWVSRPHRAGCRKARMAVRPRQQVPCAPASAYLPLLLLLLLPLLPPPAHSRAPRVIFSVVR